jgi:hypothetical protein
MVCVAIEYRLRYGQLGGSPIPVDEESGSGSASSSSSDDDREHGSHSRSGDCLR